MKVVQVCPYPFPSLGGPAKSYVHFNRIMHSKVIGLVRACHADQEQPVVPLAATVTVYDPLNFGYYYYATAGQMKEAEQLVAEADCVFVHGFFLYPEIWTRRVCRKYGVPFVIVPHGIFDPWALQKNRLLKSIWMGLYGREILQQAAAVLFATEKEKIKTRCVPPGIATRVIKWGIDAPDLTMARTKRTALRAQLGIAESDRVLIFLGRLHSMKCPKETVRWLAGFNLPGLKLLVVGPDGDVTQGQLQAEAKAVGWEGLRAVGAVWGDQKYEYLCAADGYISLSHRENFNYTLGEAMMAGLPTILSVGNDLGLEFEREGFSWQLHDDNLENLKMAVQEFAQFPSELLRARGERASHWARQYLSMERFDHELLLLLRDIIGRKKKQQVTLARFTAVVLTKNEAPNLERCLASLRWCAEIIVLDSGSTDGTPAKAQALGARVCVHVPPPPFKIAEQRNWALDHAAITTPWVLFLDADETVPPDLVIELQRVGCDSGGVCDALELTPRYLFWGQWLKRTQGYPNWHPRVVRLGHARFAGGVWEHFTAGTRVGRIAVPYDHFANSKGLSDWLVRHDRYSAWDAEKITNFLESGHDNQLETTRKLGLRRWAARLWPIRPWVRFGQMYFLRRGFLEGRAGFVFCLLYFFYEWMTVVKIVELRRRRRGQPL